MVRPLFELVCLMCQAWPATASPLPPYSLWQEALRAPPQIAGGLLELEALAQDAPPPIDVPALRSPSGVGGEWKLQHGRQLVVYMTPSPRHCAPLLEMDF